MAGDAYGDVNALWWGGALALSSTGSLQSVLASVSAGPAPALPLGVRYESCSVGYNFVAARASNGMVYAWGANNWGQTVVPPLGSNQTYVKVDAGAQHAVALRSDGTAMAWGDNSWGQTVIPPLPAGQSYIDVSAGVRDTLFVRSDGSVHLAGASGGIGSAPGLPSGVRYVRVACGDHMAIALRSDGSVVSWGSPPVTVPPLPTGLSYVEIRCAIAIAIARRSDGQVVVLGTATALSNPPTLGAGRSFLRVAANTDSLAGLVGSASSYVPIGPGCGGSQPAARLVPQDTPVIGRPLRVHLTNLPMAVGVVVFGWNQLGSGVSLAAIGMPGCMAHVSIDAAAVVTGSGNEADLDLQFPYNPALIGLQFHNQALVFDPASGNPFGAVVSEAMRGIIGG